MKSTLIPLTQGQSARIDAEDLESVKKHHWFAIKTNGRYYACAHGKEFMYLHRFVVGASSKEKTKIKTDDKLDCRKKNIIKWKIETSKRKPYKKKRLRIDTYVRVKTKYGWKVKVPLTKGHHALIDPSDLPEVSKYTWRAFYCRGSFYAATTLKDEGSNYGAKLLKMHNLIMRPNSSQLVDHANGDGFDNTKRNLRFCSRMQNSWNRKKNRGKLWYKGVYRRKTNWHARIQYNGIVKLLGQFETETKAAKAYDKAARKYHGEFACLNFPVEK